MSDESFDEFAARTLKIRSSRKARIRNTFNSYDIYKVMRKNHWYNIGKPVTEYDYYRIIRGINSLLAKEIAIGHEVVLPFHMGTLGLISSERGVALCDGKLKITYPIDWRKTLELWHEDEEERKKKTLVRMENERVYRVSYYRGNADYNNKNFYQFFPSRSVKAAIKNNIENRQIDTVW